MERFGFLGGNATAGLVGPFMTSYSQDGKIQLIKGVFEELVERPRRWAGRSIPARLKAAASTPAITYATTGTLFDPEAVKLVAAEMCLEAGVDLRLHTFVVDTLVDDGGVSGGAGRQQVGPEAIRAKVTVDCSADADIAARAGRAVPPGA